MSRVEALLKPTRLWRREEILSRPCPIPQESGVYAWYFLNEPRLVSTEGSHEFNDHKLLYVGIAPSAPPKNGKSPSRSHLRKRIQTHLRGNASGSTLRMTLGCLLADDLGLQLRRTASGKFHFAESEKILSRWIEDNAFVAWIVDPEPWLLEERLIKDLSLPLNISQNRSHPFYAKLKEVRREARVQASQRRVWKRGERK